MQGGEDEAGAKARGLGEARAWMTRLGAPNPTARAQAEFIAWVTADPRHECAFGEASMADPSGGASLAGATSALSAAHGITDSIDLDGGGLDALALDASLRCEVCGHALHDDFDDGVLSAHVGPSFAAAAAVAAAAAGWAERLAAGASPADYDGLRAWLRRDPGHGPALAGALSALTS